MLFFEADGHKSYICKYCEVFKCRYYRIAIWVQAKWSEFGWGGMAGWMYTKLLFTFKMEALKMTGQTDLTQLLFSVQFKDNVRLLSVAI